MSLTFSTYFGKRHFHPTYLLHHFHKCFQKNTEKHHYLTRWKVLEHKNTWECSGSIYWGFKCCDVIILMCVCSGAKFGVLLFSVTYVWDSPFSLITNKFSFSIKADITMHQIYKNQTLSTLNPLRWWDIGQINRHLAILLHSNSIWTLKISL